MKREEIANAIIKGMYKAQTKYIKWMDGFSITGGPEYFLTVKIAEELDKLSDDFVPVLESSLRIATDNSGVKEKSKKISNSNGRGDIVLYYKGNPYSVIEVKRNHCKLENCLNDIDRICEILSHEKSETTWKNGFFAFILEKNYLKENSIDINKIVIDEIKKVYQTVQSNYPEQTKEYYYETGNYDYIGEDDKERKRVSAFVCMTFN